MKKQVYMLLASLLTAAQAFAGGSLDCCYESCDFDSVFTIDLGGGLRKDKIKWKSFVPGVETKEKWHDLKIGEIDGTAKFLVCEQYLMRFDVDYGWIYHHGHQRVKRFDTDVIPQVMLSDLTAKTKGHVYDLSGALGYQFNWCSYQYAFTPMVGYSYNVQNLKDHGYHNDLDREDKAFVGVDNSYRYRWRGPWVGFSAVYQPTCEWQIYADYAYHWARVRASINENFALDEAHGTLKSNKAHGNEFSVGTSYVFCNCWSLGLKLNYKQFAGHKGRITSDDSCASLRGLKWTSYGGTLDLGYSF